MRRLKILHRTYYNFRGAVQLQPPRLLLRPREGLGLHIEFSKFDIAPATQIRWHRDAYDSCVAVATYASPTAQLAIVSECIVQQFDETPLSSALINHNMWALECKTAPSTCIGESTRLT